MVSKLGGCSSKARVCRSHACRRDPILAGVVVHDLPGWLQHNATVVAAAAIVAQVVALSFVYQWLAVALNYYENHATEAAYISIERGAPTLSHHDLRQNETQSLQY
ncbi:Aste57867_11896 [Aphanomyces stellatus]|uniref:Aste57867_11896 protein n=1 Tax=Aphanomyces stellatus TaxID=120398 RepID=A0A485KU75_9STRA|nr:hypothetical protein As57867_011851 [Aphanomyces stellatus]VFT88751.1 Aste57867_11896 [Aphanomyces stellatus]